jgi:hypothetical protein
VSIVSGKYVPVPAIVERIAQDAASEANDIHDALVGSELLIKLIALLVPVPFVITDNRVAPFVVVV